MVLKLKDIEFVLINYTATGIRLDVYFTKPHSNCRLLYKAYYLIAFNNLGRGGMKSSTQRRIMVWFEQFQNFVCLKIQHWQAMFCFSG